MNCKHQKEIGRWIDGEIEAESKTTFEKHLALCSLCQKEVASLDRLKEMLRTVFPTVEPSPNFEAIFWKRVLEQEREPWLTRLFHGLDALIPPLNLSQTAAVLCVALLIGGTGGVFSNRNAFPASARQGPMFLKSLSGFQEYKGVPATSLAASYLKTLERRSSVS